MADSSADNSLAGRLAELPASWCPDSGFLVHLPMPPEACVRAMAPRLSNMPEAYAAERQAFAAWHNDALGYCAIAGVQPLHGPVKVLILIPRGLDKAVRGGLLGCVWAFLERERLIADPKLIADVCTRYGDDGLLAVAVWQFDPAEQPDDIEVDAG
jgi:hypothetical protein